jgi:hypothetical protein
LELNGVYKNNSSRDRVLNEIAVRIDNNEEGIEGQYHSSYFNAVEPATLAILNITRDENQTLIFEWLVNNRPAFRGIGYLMNVRQISIYYWSV